MYFASKLAEKKLMTNVIKDLEFVDDSFKEYRVISEFGQIISSQLQAMKNAKFKISEEVVDVITKKPSKFYLAELTHLSKNEYNQEFRKYYRFFIDHFHCKESPVSILEIGSGIANLGNFLTNSVGCIQSYTICEKNSDLVALSAYLYPELQVRVINCDFREASFGMPYDCVIIENTLKFVKLIDTESFLRLIFKTSPKAEIILLDNADTLSQISELSYSNGLLVNRIDESRMIISKEHSCNQF